MREIKLTDLTSLVERLFLDANFKLPDKVHNALLDAKENEVSETGKAILDDIIQNAQLASSEKMPLCQDTGFSVVFIKIGKEVKLIGESSLQNAVDLGVRHAYKKGYLRKSILTDPLDRSSNTGDNTPSVLWTEIVEGDIFQITVMPKGGGSENMSTVKMMKPADGVEGVKSFVMDFVEKAGGNPCPPIVVGIAIGGTFEKCAYLAKKALLRDIGEHNPNPKYARLEEELLQDINKLGVGPMGLGGRTTALDVHIEYYPCHIATFPVAINICCHSERVKKGSL